MSILSATPLLNCQLARLSDIETIYNNPFYRINNCEIFLAVCLENHTMHFTKNLKITVIIETVSSCAK